MEKSFDLIVLGAGSGGLAAAKRAASYGAKVAIVEGDRVGGTCVIRGCVPKKLLAYGSLYKDHIEAAPSFGVCFSNAHIDAGILLNNVRTEVDRLNALHISNLKKSGVELISGWGSFASAHCIDLAKEKGGPSIRQICGESILIAVGGRPSRPAIQGASLGWVSDEMFLQKSFPEKVVVVGGGYIACEFSSILTGLGISVTQLVRGPHLLRGFDHELSLSLENGMKEYGVDFLFETVPTLIQGSRGDISLSTNHAEEISCGGVLLATGRKPFLDNLRLDSVGIKLAGERIMIDNHQTTNVKNIFAVGDVTDRINLTPVAIDEGRAFADHLYGGKSRKVNYDLVASAVFSYPEIATVGLSEDKAKKLYGSENITVLKSCFRPMSKALSKKGSKCLLKLVLDKNSEEIIGCHMAGENAAEIIQMAAIPIGMKAKKSDFDNTMALHPSIAEEFVTMT